MLGRFNEALQTAADVVSQLTKFNVKSIVLVYQVVMYH